MKKLLTTVAVLAIGIVTFAKADESFGAKDFNQILLTYSANKLRFDRDYAGRAYKSVWNFQGAEYNSFEKGVRISVGGSADYNSGIRICVLPQIRILLNERQSGTQGNA